MGLFIRNASTRQHLLADGYTLVCATGEAPRLRTAYCGQLSRTISRREAARRLRAARGGVETHHEACEIETPARLRPTGYCAVRSTRRLVMTDH